MPFICKRTDKDDSIHLCSVSAKRVVGLPLFPLSLAFQYAATIDRLAIEASPNDLSLSYRIFSPPIPAPQWVVDMPDSGVPSDCNRFEVLSEVLWAVPAASTATNAFLLSEGRTL